MSEEQKSLVSLIRPGIMVALKSSVQGGIQYKRVDLNADRTLVAAPETASVSVWETTRVIEDPAEYDNGAKTRAAALNLIRKHCAITAFGLLCPESLEEEMDRAVLEARGMIQIYNSYAKHTSISLYVLKGRIAASDEEAARAIGNEVKGLIEGMSGAIDRLEPEAIREAASKAKQMLSMLAPEQSAKVSLAIDAARKAARTIVARVEKKGEVAADVLKDIQKSDIENARIAFLDFDTKVELPSVEMPGVEMQRFDFDE